MVSTSTYSIGSSSCVTINSMKCVFDLAQKEDLAANFRVLAHLDWLTRARKDIVALVCTKYDLNIDL